MKIKFKFDDGTLTEVEVDDEYGKKYLEELRKEENDNRKYRYWVVQSLDTADYEGEWFSSNDPTPLEKLIIEDEQKEVDAFKKTLTEIQRRRLEMLEDGMSQAEIAREEKTTHRAIQKTIEQLQIKFKKYFKK